MTIPQLVGHRGYPKHYPENTICGLEAAAPGACFLEIDVQVTKDGVPVVIHDTELKRTGGRRGSVLDMDFASLKGVVVDERDRLSKAFDNARVPALKDVVAWVERHPVPRLFVEIKRASMVRFGRSAVVNQVLQVLTPIEDRAIVISFDYDALRLARSAGAPAVGWVMDTWDGDSLDALQDLAPEYAFIDYTKVPHSVHTLPTGPWQWALYDIVDPELALDWARRGASLIETWAIGEMLGHPVLGRRACGG
jgi:glycerophosphoryl diester phosphodiesterase